MLWILKTLGLDVSRAGSEERPEPAAVRSGSRNLAPDSVPTDIPCRLTRVKPFAEICNPATT